MDTTRQDVTDAVARLFSTLLDPLHTSQKCGDSDVVHAFPSQPSESDQNAFSRPLICTGARRNPAMCGTNQRDRKRRFALPLRAGGEKDADMNTIAV